MASLPILPPDSSPETIAEATAKEGACIIEGVLDDATIDRFLAEADPFVDATPEGRDDFSGRHTRRTGALVARVPSSREIVMNPAIVAAANTFLAPYTTRIILHLTQTIFIGPGQGSQPLHRDRLAWGGYIPRSIEPQFNTIWALTDFTAENGATRVVPGSNHWPDEQRAESDQICQAEMSRGSVLIYSGSVIHSGGQNNTEAVRKGLNITYCLAWLRQEENQYLSCPPHIARHLDSELQALLGYTMGNYALGYFSDPDMSMGKGAGELEPEQLMGGRSDGVAVPSSGANYREGSWQ